MNTSLNSKPVRAIERVEVGDRAAYGFDNKYPQKCPACGSIWRYLYAEHDAPTDYRTCTNQYHEQPAKHGLFNYGGLTAEDGWGVWWV